MSPPLSDEAQRAVQLGMTAAQGHGPIGGRHLLLGVLEATDRPDSAVSRLLQRCGAAREEVRLQAFTVPPASLSTAFGAPLTQRVLGLAAQEARRLRQERVGAEHLLIALVSYEVGEPIGDLLRPLGLTQEQLRAHLAAMGQGQVSPSGQGGQLAANVAPLRRSGGSQAARQPAAPPSRDLDWVRLDWRYVLGGMGWWIVPLLVTTVFAGVPLLSSLNVLTFSVLTLSGALLFAVAISMVPDLRGWRDAVGSFLFGWLVVGVLLMIHRAMNG